MKSAGSWLPDPRHIWAIDSHPGWRRWVKTSYGQILVAVVAAIVLWPHFSVGEIIVGILSALLAARLQRQRAFILFVGTWLCALLGAWFGWTDLLANVHLVAGTQVSISLQDRFLALMCIAACCIGSVLFLVGASRYPRSFFARHSFLTLLAILAMLVIVGTYTSQSLARISWLAAVTLAPYLWFIPYAVVAARADKAGTLLVNLSSIRPFWSPTYLPFGKGFNYLEKYRAITPEAIAITQLKGIKLLVWGSCIYGLNQLLTIGLPPEITDLDTAINQFLVGRHYSVVSHWMIVFVSTLRYSLNIAMWAHFFVGIARLAGYQLPRGSWRPLESRTLADYFNRFHFYFKELLVDLFFVPTFFRVFKKSPRLRIFFATFMAAGVGNALWHFTREINLVFEKGIDGSLSSFTSYLFYCLILSVSIGISQIRAANLQVHSNYWFARLRDFVFVWSFVALLHIFGNGSREHGFGDRILFFFSLFGV